MRKAAGQKPKRSPKASAAVQLDQAAAENRCPAAEPVQHRPDDRLAEQQTDMKNRLEKGAGCDACNRLIAQPEAIMSIGTRDWAHTGR